MLLLGTPALPAAQQSAVIPGGFKRVSASAGRSPALDVRSSLLRIQPTPPVTRDRAHPGELGQEGAGGSQCTGVSPGEMSHHTIQPTDSHHCSLGFCPLCAPRSDEGHLNLMRKCSNTDMPKLCCLLHPQSLAPDTHPARQGFLQPTQRGETHL